MFVRRDASNEYPQHIFSRQNKKHIGTYRKAEKKKPYLELGIHGEGGGGRGEGGGQS